MKQFLKLTACAFVILHFLAWSYLIGILVRSRNGVRRFRIRSAHKHCRVLCAILGVDVSVENADRLSGRSRFIVANHLSYLDTFALLSIKPLCFVTSVEMREYFPLGFITEMAGCLYVERRSTGNILGEIDEVSAALKTGFSVVVFPEATSSNGSQLLPFKKALFTAATLSEIPVLPVALLYQSIDDEPITLTNRDVIFWYGDMDFLPHFLPLLRMNRIQLTISALHEIAVHPGTKRHEVSALAREQIASIFKPVT